MQQTAYAKFVYERHTRRRGGGHKSEEDRSCKNLLKDACRKVIAFLFTQVGVCALVVAYNIVGAFAFHALEGVAGDATPELMADAVLNTSVVDLWRVTKTFNVLAEEEWKEQVMGTLQVFQDTLVPLIKHKGYRGVHPSIAWSPPAALMYSLSVYTTIGYGNLAPRTAAGKAVTILYAIVGMPLMLLYMANVGEVLANIFKFIYFRACRCDIGSLGYYRTPDGALVQVTAQNRGLVPPLSQRSSVKMSFSNNSSRHPSARSTRDVDAANRYEGRDSRRLRPIFGSMDDDSAYVQLPPELHNKAGFYKPRISALAASMAETGMVVGSIAGGRTVENSAPSLDEGRKTIPITWALVVLASYVTSGGLLFAHWENWSVLDGCYFCYISLSTIGFGDLVPGRIVTGDDGDMLQVDSKQIICTIYLLVGMALVAMCFNLMQEEAIENLRTFWRSLGCIRKHVKRGRDKLRGKRRPSAMLLDEDLRDFDLSHSRRNDGRQPREKRERRRAVVRNSAVGSKEQHGDQHPTMDHGYPDRQGDRWCSEDAGYLDCRADPGQLDRAAVYPGSPHQREDTTQINRMGHMGAMERRGDQRQLDRRRLQPEEGAAVERPDVTEKSNRSTIDCVNDVDAIIVSDYDREYDIWRTHEQFRRTSEMEKPKKPGSPEIRDDNIEMKYYKDTKSKQWHKYSPDHDRK